MTGSQYFLAGGITELNTSIRSIDFPTTIATKAAVAEGNAKPNVYVMNIGMDLRLVDTTSLDIVDIVSYQKQIIGYQVGAGLFSFFGDQVLSVSANASGEEPVQLAVRALVERTVVQMVSKLYGIEQSACLDPNSDPLANRNARTASVQAQPSMQAAPPFQAAPPMQAAQSFQAAPPMQAAQSFQAAPPMRFSPPMQGPPPPAPIAGNMMMGPGLRPTVQGF